MNLKVSVKPRWSGPVPIGRNGKPLPKNQWARAGRKRKWCVRWFAPDGSRPRKTFNTKESAEAFAREKVQLFESRGSLARVQPKRLTIGAFVKELLELRTGPTGRRWSAGSLAEYRTVLHRFAGFIGEDVPLDRVAPSDGLRYVASLRSPSDPDAKPLCSSTINKHKRHLKCAFNTAVVQLCYLRLNPFERLREDRIAERPVRYLEPSEYRAIIDACRAMADALWWECFLATCYTSGTRLNEAAHLTWADIDFETSVIRIVAKSEVNGIPAWRPKDHDSRTIPVPELTIDLLTQLHVEAEPGQGFVFLSPARVAWIHAKRQAGQWSEGQQVLNNVNRGFQARADKADVRDVSIHDLRRSAITHWARKLPVAVVKELAGHADVKTTLPYSFAVRREPSGSSRHNAECSCILTQN